MLSVRKCLAVRALNPYAAILRHQGEHDWGLNNIEPTAQALIEVGPMNASCEVHIEGLVFDVNRQIVVNFPFPRLLEGNGWAMWIRSEPPTTVRVSACNFTGAQGVHIGGLNGWAGAINNQAGPASEATFESCDFTDFSHAIWHRLTSPGSRPLHVQGCTFHGNRWHAEHHFGSMLDILSEVDAHLVDCDFFDITRLR